MKQRLVVGIVLCALLVGLGIGPVWAAPPATNQIVHVVRWGENLTYIAGQYGTTVQAIMNANGISNPNRIYAGQRLLIPGAAPAPAPVPTCGQVYTIQIGDTLSGIAYRFGISSQRACPGQQHREPEQHLLRPAAPDSLRDLHPPQPCPPPAPPPPVPQPPPPPQPAQPSAGWWYVVQAGRHAWPSSRGALASVSGIIVQANNLPNPNLICVGQKLFVPNARAHAHAHACPSPPGPEPGCEHLLTPRRGETLSGTVQVKGTADIANFWYYKLEFRHDGLDNWHYITGQHTRGRRTTSWEAGTPPRSRRRLHL